MNLHVFYDPAIPVLDTYPRKMQLATRAARDMLRNVHCNVIHDSPKMETIQKYIIKRVD